MNNDSVQKIDPFLFPQRRFNHSKNISLVFQPVRSSLTMILFGKFPLRIVFLLKITVGFSTSLGFSSILIYLLTLLIKSIEIDTFFLKYEINLYYFMYFNFHSKQYLNGLFGKPCTRLSIL